MSVRVCVQVGAGMGTEGKQRRDWVCCASGAVHQRNMGWLARHTAPPVMNAAVNQSLVVVLYCGEL